MSSRFDTKLASMWVEKTGKEFFTLRDASYPYTYMPAEPRQGSKGLVSSTLNVQASHANHHGHSNFYYPPATLSSSPRTSNFNLLARPGAVDQIMRENDLLMAGKATGWHGAGALLQRELLIVTIYGLRAVNLQQFGEHIISASERHQTSTGYNRRQT